MTPLFDFIPPLAYPIDYVVFGGFIVLVAGMALVRGRAVGWFALSAIIIAMLFILQDQSRLQPWFYLYTFIIAAIGLCERGLLSVEDALNTCRLVIAFTYFWSGLQKANASFIQIGYPWLIKPLTPYLSESVQAVLAYSAYAAPIFEVAIGLGLLSRRFRNPAAIGALLMHTLILMVVGPWGYDWNQVIWPWNIAMVAFVFILFWNRQRPPATETSSSRDAASRSVPLFEPPY